MDKEEKSNSVHDDVECSKESLETMKIAGVGCNIIKKNLTETKIVDKEEKTNSVNDDVEWLK